MTDSIAPSSASEVSSSINPAAAVSTSTAHAVDIEASPSTDAIEQLQPVSSSSPEEAVVTAQESAAAASQEGIENGAPQSAVPALHTADQPVQEETSLGSDGRPSPEPAQHVSVNGHAAQPEPEQSLGAAPPEEVAPAPLVKDVASDEPDLAASSDASASEETSATSNSSAAPSDQPNEVTPAPSLSRPATDATEKADVETAGPADTEQVEPVAQKAARDVAPTSQVADPAPSSAVSALQPTPNHLPSSSPAAAPKPALPPKKFSSVNVNKKFLEKAGTPSPALGPAGSTSDASAKASIASPSLAAARLRAAKGKDAPLTSPSVGSKTADTSSPGASATSVPAGGPGASESNTLPPTSSSASGASTKLVTGPASASSPGSASAGSGTGGPLSGVAAQSGTSALRTRSPAGLTPDDGPRAAPSPSTAPRHAVLSVKSTTLSTVSSSGSAGAGAANAGGSGTTSKAPWANLVSGSGSSAQPATTAANATAAAVAPVASSIGGGSAARFAASLAGGSRSALGSGGGLNESRYGGGRWTAGAGGYEEGYRPREIVPGPSAFPPLGTDTRDFPTAAEAKTRQREKDTRVVRPGAAAAGPGARRQNAAAAAAAAAASAAANESALRSLDRFRGESLSGNRWDDLLGDDADSDEDGRALFGKDGVLDFGDGQVYHIDPQELERREKEREQELQVEAARREEAEVSKWGRLKESERIPSSGAAFRAKGGLGARSRDATGDADRDGAPSAPVSKEERFADVNHDRSWPGGAAAPRRRESAFSGHHDEVPKGSAGKSAPAPWGPLAIAQGKLPKPSGGTLASATPAPISSKTGSASRDTALPPEPAIARQPPPKAPASASHPQQRGPGEAITAPAPAPAARAWGPLAQRAASLGFAPAPAPVVPAAASSASASAHKPSTAASSQAPAAVPTEIIRRPAAVRPLPPHLIGRAGRATAAAGERDSRRTDDVDATGHRAPPAPVISQGNERTKAPLPAAESRLPISGKEFAEKQHEEMISAAERARRRRDEEEAQRAAERERARLKAQALEQKLEAERAEKERIAQAKAEAEAAALRKRQEEVAAAAERRKKEQQEALERRRRTAEEAQARALAKKEEESLARERSSMAAGQDTARPSQPTGLLRSESSGRNEEGAPLHRRPVPPPSASSEQASWRRSSGLVLTDAPTPATATSKNMQVISILPRQRAPEAQSKDVGPEAARPTSSERQTSKAPPPPTPSTEASTWRRKDPLPPLSPPSERERPHASRTASRGERGDAAGTEAYTNGLDDIISRIKGAIHSTGPPNQAVVSLPSKQFSKRRAPSPVRKSPHDAVDAVTVGDDVLGLNRGNEKRAKVRFGPTVTTMFGRGTVPKVPDRSLLSETRALRSSLASRLLRPMGGLAGAPPEPLITRLEISADPAPIWKQFVVRLKPSRPAPYLTRQQMQAQKAALANANVLPRPIYPLTWDPPILTLPIKTLNRDDHFFSKKFQHGKVITLVQLPPRSFSKFLGPATVSSVVAPSVIDPDFAPQTASELVMDFQPRRAKYKGPAKNAPVVRVPYQNVRKAIAHTGPGPIDSAPAQTNQGVIGENGAPLPSGPGLAQATIGTFPPNQPSHDRLSYQHTHGVPPPSAQARHVLLPNGGPAPAPHSSSNSNSRPLSSISPQVRRDSINGVAYSRNLQAHAPEHFAAANAPSPVQFTVHSEVEGVPAPPQTRDLPPHMLMAKDGSRANLTSRARSAVSNSAAAQPSTLPSPGRHSTASQVWGFPTSGAPPIGMPGSEQIKNLWTFQASKDDTDVQKSVRSRETDFGSSSGGGAAGGGPSMSMSIHDLRTEGGAPAAQASRSAVAVQASKSFPRLSNPAANGAAAAGGSSSARATGATEGAAAAAGVGAVSMGTSAATSPMLQQQNADAGMTRSISDLDFAAAADAGHAPGDQGASLLQSSPSTGRAMQAGGSLSSYPAQSFNGTQYGFASQQQQQSPQQAQQQQRYPQAAAYGNEHFANGQATPSLTQSKGSSSQHIISAYAAAFQPASATASRFYGDQAKAAGNPYGGPMGGGGVQTSAAGGGGLTPSAGSWPSPVASQMRLAPPPAAAKWNEQQQQQQQMALRWQQSGDAGSNQYGIPGSAAAAGAGTYSPQQQTYSLHGYSATGGGGQGSRSQGGDSHAGGGGGYALEGRTPIGSLSQHVSPQLLTNARYPQSQQAQQQHQAMSQQYGYQQQQQQQSLPMFSQSSQAGVGRMGSSLGVGGGRYGQAQAQQSQMLRQQQQHYQQAQQYQQMPLPGGNLHHHHPQQQQQQQQASGDIYRGYFHDPSASFW